MSIMSRAHILVAFGLIAATTVAAQEPAAPAPIPAPAPAPPIIQLALDIGFVNSTGNTEVTILSFAENLSFKLKPWEFKEGGAVVYGRNGDSITAEQYKVDARIDRQLVSIVHVFVGGMWEQNRFAGIARRFEEYAGLAIRFVNTPANLWVLETGGSLNQQTNTTGQTTSYRALRSAMRYRHNFPKAAYFQQSVVAIPNVDNWTDLRINSETALVVPVAGPVAISLGYMVWYDNLPVPGFLKTDRIFTTSLQIVF